jgi:hypothetical protein
MITHANRQLPELRMNVENYNLEQESLSQAVILRYRGVSRAKKYGLERNKH